MRIIFLVTLLICQNIFSQSIPEFSFLTKLSASSKLYFIDECSDLFVLNNEGKLPISFQTKANCEFTINNISINNYNLIHTALVTRAELLQILNNECVEYLEISSKLNAPRPMVDTTKILTGVYKVHDGLTNGLTKNYKGKNVVLGIVDIGFQTDHPNFLNSDGSALRIKSFWHQGWTGNAPTGFNYGSVNTSSAAIKAMIDMDGLHGTHVAGIAGGSGFTTINNKYSGMAPEADFVFVGIKYANDTLPGSALGDYIVANPTILDAYKYVFDFASKQGKPAVTNLSWGMHTGPHDGTSIFDKALSSIAGPGKIIVGAAGNDGENNMHLWSSNSKLDTVYTFAYDRSRNDYNPEEIYCDFWGEKSKTLRLNIAVFDTLGNLILQTPFTNPNFNTSVKNLYKSGNDTLWLTLSGNSNYINNGKPNILLIAKTNNAKKLRMRVGIIYQGIFHAWNSGQARRWTSGSFSNNVKGNNYSNNARYLNGTTNFSVGENGGTGDVTISAGAYIARNSWNDFNGKYYQDNNAISGGIAKFSSRGPRPDNRIKPDILAPGQFIAASVNRRTFPGWLFDKAVAKTTFDGNDEYWALLSGTSMASPHVAGIVALMLEANPKLTPLLTKQIITTTAIRDQFTGNDSNVEAGYGKINAFAAVQTAYANYLANTHNKGANYFYLYPNPSNSMVHFNCPFPVNLLRVYDVSGKLKLEVKNPSNFIQTQNWLNGTYLFEILTENGKFINKFIKY